MLRGLRVGLFALAVAGAAHASDPQGHLLTVEGTVERSTNAGEAWSAAATDEQVFVRDLVKTGGRSRTAVLLVDETQLRLNAYSLLEIHDVRAGDGETRLGLERGEAWLRSKNGRRSLAVDTPSATAAIRGTEVNVRSDGELTEIIVVEGAVDFFNDHGAIEVRAGEGARARIGEAPQKFVVLEPENAVQWIVFYPDLDDGPAGGPPPGPGDALVASAAAALAHGDVSAAVATLQTVLADDPADRQALALLALIRLIGNHTDEAEALIERARAVGDDHFLTRLVASKIEQARFRLPEAIAHARAALALRPDSVEATASLAELLYGSARTEEAAALIDRQVASHPDASRLLTVRGFVAFGLDRVADAEADLARALTLDPQRAEARLGLGLARFQQGRRADGLVEMLAATCLAPQVSLYQSYLGKAYHESGRHAAALAALETAQRLDPRDPTPHLYAALIHRDLNRHRAAAEQLDLAIRKNDHRAVYRSRLLLDRDEATANVTLAEIYRNLRWTALGAYHAIRSLELDYSNSAAHLFAAGTLIDEPDRTAAAASELLVARLLQPVNQNSFNTFNQYSSLLVTGGWEPRLRAGSGRHERSEIDGTLIGGNNRVALFALASHEEHAGFVGPNSDTDDNIGNVAVKLALGTRQSLLLDLQAGDSEFGLPGDVAAFFDPAGGIVSLRLLRPEDPDLNDRLRLGLEDQFAGYHNRLGPNHNLLVAVNRRAFESRSTDPDALADTDPNLGLTPCGTRSFGDDELGSFQAAHHWIRGRHQLFGGVEWARRDKHSRGTLFCPSGPFAGQEAETSRLDLRDDFGAAWGRYTVRGRRDSTLTLELRYDAVELQDSLGTEVFPVDETWLSPRIGVRWQLDPRSALRIAAFRNVGGADNTRLSPQLIAGFSLRRTEAAADLVRDEIDVAYDRDLGGRGFVGVSVYHREIDAPVLTFDSQFNTLRVRQESEATGGKLDVDWRLAPRWTGFAELQRRNIDTPAFEQDDFQVRVGARLIHPTGWFVDVEQTYLDQSYRSRVVGLPETGVWLTRFSAIKEYPGKRARAGLEVDNVFDQRFNVAIEGLSVNQRQPTRTALAFLQWNF